MDGMRTAKLLLPLLLSLGLLVGGCGDESEPATDDPSTPTSSPATPSEEPTRTPSEKGEEPGPEGPVVDIAVEGDSISPNGERVEGKVGEPITLDIRSDRAGELHVHSTPEQTVDFESGTTTAKLTIDQPGVVEVEEHESGFVVLQLQIS
jgi:hypothetical protein